MTCAGCNAIETAPKTLLDGRVVCTSCEDWRFEAEARFIARQPSPDARAEWIEQTAKKRGKEAGDALREFIRANWKALRA